ncbi:MAG: hypothetical protein HC772_04455 [Leptolyngbyaceae cyanobacterium CRU_2_3]|nr:hypothetical protein [Leptolyngbyaceae cyanobacterium CRU_2_3]
MNPSLDETLSQETAKRIKSKARSPFENAYQAALTNEEALYVQGFLVIAGKPYSPMEHAWLEVGDRILDPTLPHLGATPQQLHYFPAQKLKVKKLKAAVEEAKEDYPEDDPLPIYGDAPYAYYGDVMLGGQNYLDAHQAAAKLSKDLNKPYRDLN